MLSLVKNMSRIGKQPVKIPEGVTITVDKETVVVNGPKGNLSFIFRPEVKITVEDGKVIVDKNSNNPKASSLWGLTRSLIDNMVYGVTTGWNKGLEMTGVGYRSAIEGNNLVLNVGFSHQVKFPIPEGITITITKEGIINVSGCDKQLVGETAAQIRKIRPPEPYKGKGIHYVGEKIRRKAGKAAKAVGAATK